MSTPVIRVEGIGKKYHIGLRSQSYPTLRDAIVSAATSPFHRAERWFRRQPPQERYETFWALKDISFDVHHGEVIGIIGKNGAGKSTILKILSRITEPTEGYAEIHGRVRSLLEVGTGFHPELTGRENIFLNGAILGMRKIEIKRKFDEIVAFSEIEKFLDTPVKHYSSGMFVRLAFAVAAHLEPEILIIDEVLSVGDIGFQRKCLGKISEVSRGGRTVVFVSHNVAAIENLCNAALVLREGRVAFSGPTKDCVDYYLHRLSTTSAGQFSSIVDLSAAPRQSSKYRPYLRRLEFLDGNGSPLNRALRVGETLTLRLYFHLDEDTSRFQLGVGFNSMRGERIFTAHTVFQPHLQQSLAAGEHAYFCEIPSLSLVPGEYKLRVAMALSAGDVDVVEDAAQFNVIASDFYGTGKLPWAGQVVMKHHWYAAPVEAVQEAVRGKF